MIFANYQKNIPSESFRGLHSAARCSPKLAEHCRSYYQRDSELMGQTPESNYIAVLLM